MKLHVRRPVIWALGIIILVLLIFSTRGNTLYYHTDLDEVMYESAADDSQAAGDSQAADDEAAGAGDSQAADDSQAAGDSQAADDSQTDASEGKLGNSKSAQITAKVENIVRSETSIKVTLTDCAVKIDEKNTADNGTKLLEDDNTAATYEPHGDANTAATYEPHGLVAYFDNEESSSSNGESVNSGKVTLGGESFTVGDTVLISGTLKCIDTPDNPGEFNSWRYYRCRGIDYTIYPDSVKVVSTGSGLKTSLYKIRQSLYDAIDNVSEDENEAAFFKAMLFGDKSSLDEDLYLSFQICGIAHILAVGGLHLTIIGGIILHAVKKLLDLISKLKKKISVSSYNSNSKIKSESRLYESKTKSELCLCESNSWLDNPRFTLLISSIVADAFLLAFIIMIDGSVSAWRAYIMFTLMLIAPLIGRTYDTLSGLGLAGILILITDPLYALDTSFQLSFAAIFGVGVVFPRFKNIAEELRPRDEKGRKKDLGFVYYKIITPLLFSLSIQITTIPVVLNNFYTISLYGIFLNLIIIPFMSIVLVSIFGAAIFASLSGGVLVAASKSTLSLEASKSLVAASKSTLSSSSSFFITVGRFFAGAAHYFFKILTKICEFVQNLPGASIVLGKPPTWKIVAYYLVLGIVMLILGRPIVEFIKNKLEGITNPVITGETNLAQYEIPVRRISKRFLAVLLIVPMILIMVPVGNGCFGTFVDAKSNNGVGVAIDSGTSNGSKIMLTSLYVGQGDSTIVTLPNHHAIIFDAGSSSKTDVSKTVILPYLKATALTQVDMIILSHPDIDHINGVVKILESPYVKVGGVAVAKTFAQNTAWDEIKEACVAEGVNFYYLEAGDEISFSSGTVTATAISPSESSGSAASSSSSSASSSTSSSSSSSSSASSSVSGSSSSVSSSTSDSSSSSSTNDGSLVMRLDYGEFSALFTGDISSEEESKILKSDANLDVTYLKCPHHGSKYSSSEEFLAAVSPIVTTVSAGRGNSYGHPTEAALNRIAAAGSNIFITKTQGAILTSVTASGKISVKTWR